MKILVAIKRVIDPYVKVRINAEQTGAEVNNIKMAMNPFDEIAVEQALLLKEQGIASEIIIVSIGNDRVKETILHGLALGGCRGILVKTAQDLTPLNIAKILKELVIKENIDLALLGKQSIDGDNNQTGQMLAGLLNWPQGTFASKVIIENNKLTVVREIDEGLETLKMSLPAVVTTDLRLNEPRYATLPNIMKAKRKQIDIISLEELAINLNHEVKVSSVMEPLARSSGEIVASVDELLDKLRNEAKVI